MKSFMVVLIILMFCTFALAHEHTVSPEMRKQHGSMSVIGKQWSICKKDLNNNNYVDARKALEKIQKAVAGLEKFKPHKNSEKMDEFRQQTHIFKDNLTKLSEALTGKKSEDVKSLVGMIDNGCLKCHETFR